MGNFSDNFIIFKRDDQYIVRESIAGTEVKQTPKADEAIQFAIKQLGNSGGEVMLARGVYELRDTVRLPENITITGSGRGTKLRLADGHKTGIGLLCENVSGIVISDLCIDSENGNDIAGIIIDNSGECKVDGVFCAGFGQYGIWVRNNAFLCEIVNSSIAGNKTANVYFDTLASRGRFGDCVPNLISNCTIYGGGKGIECKKAVVLNIVGCVVYQTNKTAYHIHSYSNSVLISGCRSFQISDDVVLVEGSHELNVSSNIFCWHTGNGIVVKDCCWGTITGNEVIDTGSYNNNAYNYITMKADIKEAYELYDGIDISGSYGFTISSNTIFNWGVAPKMKNGIVEDDKCFKNLIVNNNINYYENCDIISKGKETIVDNNISHKDEAYQENESPRLQTYKVERTDDFIALQR